MITATFLSALAVLAMILIIIAIPVIIFVCIKIKNIETYIKQISIDTKFLGDSKYDEINK